jgi:hypothetical protein
MGLCVLVDVSFICNTCFVILQCIQHLALWRCSSVMVCGKLAAPEDNPFGVETCSTCYINK